MPVQSDKILVIGGRGHMGSRIAASLERAFGERVWIGSRRGGGTRRVRFDLNDKRTWSVASDFGVFVNAADDSVAPPDKFLEAVKSQNVIFMETSADARLYRRLTDRAAEFADSPMVLVLGCGVFPGLSNLLAAHAAGAADGARRLRLSISWNVMSGAGAGTCRLMVRFLTQPALLRRDGALREGPALGKIVRVKFERGERLAIECGFPESVLLGHSLGVPRVEVFASIRPSFGKGALRAMSKKSFLRFAASAPMRLIEGAYFRVLRGVALKGRTTRVEMLAEVPGSPEARRWLKVRDGMAAAGDMVAAMVAIMEKGVPGGGVYTPDMLTTLEDVADEIGRQKGKDGGVEWGAGE